MVILIDGIFVGNKKKWNKTSFSSSFDLALLVTKNPFMLQSSSNFFHFLWFGFILPAAMNQCKNEHEVEYPRILTETRRTIECCSNNMIDSMFYMKFWKLTHSLCYSKMVSRAKTDWKWFSSFWFNLISKRCRTFLFCSTQVGARNTDKIINI